MRGEWGEGDLNSVHKKSRPPTVCTHTQPPTNETGLAIANMIFCKVCASQWEDVVPRQLLHCMARFLCGYFFRTHLPSLSLFSLFLLLFFARPSPVTLTFYYSSPFLSPSSRILLFFEMARPCAIKELLRKFI